MLDSALDRTESQSIEAAMHKLSSAALATVVGTMIGSWAQAQEINLLGNAPDGTVYDPDARLEIRA